MFGLYKMKGYVFMNTIIDNGLNTYRNMQQADKQNHARIRNGNWGSTAGPLYEDVRIPNTKDSGISVQEAYERLSGSGKTLPEAEQLSPTEGKIEKVTDITIRREWKKRQPLF